MLLEPQHLARLISRETGIGFEASNGLDVEGQRWYLLRPKGLPAIHTFGVRTTIGWRRLQVVFETGNFAVELLLKMGEADETGRTAFCAILRDCVQLGAEIGLRINGKTSPYDSSEIWKQNWSRLSLSLNKGQLELGIDEGELDSEIICRWTGRFTAAIAAILPLEDEGSANDESIRKYPEGALCTVKVNRYERDRRNRAAAIAIQGTSCQACGMEFGDVYGEIAAGFIEVHHATPVSKIGPNYVIDPARDLIPLCANCHAVAHRRVPPFSVSEIRNMLNLPMST